jgi:hypothetical protein
LIYGFHVGLTIDLIVCIYLLGSLIGPINLEPLQPHAPLASTANFDYLGPMKPDDSSHHSDKKKNSGDVGFDPGSIGSDGSLAIHCATPTLMIL